MKWFKILMIMLLFTCKVAVAQNQLINTAKEYLLKQDFAKAAELFLKLNEVNSSKEVTEGYIQALIGLKDYKTAEKFTKTYLKKNKENVETTLLLAKIYTAMEEPKKTRKVLEELMANNSNNENNVKYVANLFETNGLFDYAIEMYEKAIKKSNDPLLFAEELSALYDKKGDFEKATESLINLAVQQPNKIENVKTALLRLFNQADKINIVKSKLIQRINREPDNITYPDILSWLYIQQKDYEEAFVQVKAMDIRLKEDGRRPLQFAKIATKEKEYMVALNALEYVIALGADKTMYQSAIAEKLNTLKVRLYDNAKYTQTDVQDLIKGYTQYFEINPGASTSEATINYASVLARYGNDINGAIKVLTNYIAKPNVMPIQKGKAKLDLGDYQLIAGNNWESTLLYSQVDKDFKNDVLGEEARFRNAKLSYYIGDYTWAQGQLDILKASTSELIANDALNLSVLITENIPSDSNMKPLEMFSRAELLIFQNKIEKANKTLDSITNQFSAHPLTDDVLMTKAIICFKQQKFEEALTFYKTVYTNHKEDILADDAIYQSALINENQLNNKEEAKKLYEQIILNYPGSSYIGESRKAFRKLRGDNLN